MEHIQIADIDLHYLIIGEGMPVLIVHGTNGDHRALSVTLEPIFETLTGWQRIYVDLPGHGQTPPHESVGSSEDVLDVLVAFVDAVIKERPFLVVGQSWGGYLARGLIYRKTAQTRGLLAICPTIHGARDRRTFIPEPRKFKSSPEYHHMIPEPILVGSNDMIVYETEHVFNVMARGFVPGFLISDSDFIKNIQQNGFAFSFNPDDLPAPYDEPSCFILGRYDVATGYADAMALHQVYTRASICTLDRAGHAVQMEQPEVTTALIVDWLQRVNENSTLVPSPELEDKQL